HPGPPLFPYTTLFRSEPHAMRGDAAVEQDAAVVRHLGGAPAEPLLRVLDLGERLVQMDVDAGAELVGERPGVLQQALGGQGQPLDRKSTRLNSSHVAI